MAGPGSRLRWLPLSAAIDLHEIHLAPQPSLQVPVGHIPVPGGIKLCSPGTFWVANYLIINNGSCQVNFTKPNSATSRNTNSQWLREDATEAPVGRVAVPKTGQKPPSPREAATEAPVGRVVVSKTGQKSALPRGDATEASVGRVAVPKTGQKNSLPRRVGSGALVGRVAVPKQIVRRIIMIEVKVLVGYAPWQMVSGGIGSRKRRGPRSGKALPAPSAMEQSWTGDFSGVGIGSRKEGPTKWEGPPGTICHGAIMDRLFLRHRHRLPKRGTRRRQVVEDHAGNVGRVRSERSERIPPQSLSTSRCNHIYERRLTKVILTFLSASSA